ncbi:MAG: hypothetical protein ACKOBD_15245 [Chloroflexota bacterium]
MATEIISWISVALILFTATTILVSRDWRISLGALAIQYLAAFWLVTQHLPFAMGSVKLITGWMVIAIIGMTRLSLTNFEQNDQDAFYPRGASFRIILMSIAAFVALGATPRIETSIPGLGLPVIAGGLLLIGAGVAHLGVTSDLMRVVLGLLTVLSGFEIIYAAIKGRAIQRMGALIEVRPPQVTKRGLNPP